MAPEWVESIKEQTDAQIEEFGRRLANGIARLNRWNYRAYRRSLRLAKNMYMYKTFGRRPWGARETPRPISMKLYWKSGMVRQSECNKDDMFAGPLDAVAGCHAEATALRHAYRMEVLRQQSGFRIMSQFAEYVAGRKPEYVYRRLQQRGIDMNALDILQAGLANVGFAHAIATAENNRGFDAGVRAGAGKGVLMTLNCAKKRFGSKLMRLLSEQVEKDHAEELLDG